MGRTAKFTFPLPGRKPKAPPSPSISGPLSKAQKILGTGEINVDSAKLREQREQQQQQQGHWENTSTGGISVSVSEATSQRTATNAAGGGVGVSGPEDGDEYDSLDEWELESGVMPRHLRSRINAALPPLPASRGGVTMTSDASSTVGPYNPNQPRGIRRQSSLQTLPQQYYDRSRVPLAISQQTSSSAMAKGLPSKASQILDISGDLAAGGPRSKVDGSSLLTGKRAKTKPAKLDLSYLIPKGRWGGGAAGNDRSGGGSSGKTSGGSGDRLVLGPDFATRSPSVISEASDLPASLRQRILGRKRTKESLRIAADNQSVMTSNASGVHVLVSKPSDRQLQGLYEHYEQMSFRSVMGIREEDDEGMPPSASSTNSDAAQLSPTVYNGAQAVTGSSRYRNLQAVREADRQESEPFSPTTTTRTATTTTSSTGNQSQSTGHDGTTTNTVVTTPSTTAMLSTHTLGTKSSVTSPAHHHGHNAHPLHPHHQHRPQQQQHHHHLNNNSNGSNHNHGPSTASAASVGPDYDASISSRHTRTSRTSRRTSQSVFDTDLQQRSVLSLSSDSEDDVLAGSNSNGNSNSTRTSNAVAAAVVVASIAAGAGRAAGSGAFYGELSVARAAALVPPPSAKSLAASFGSFGSGSGSGSAGRRMSTSRPQSPVTEAVGQLLPPRPQTAVPRPPSIQERTSSRQHRVSTARSSSGGSGGLIIQQNYPTGRSMSTLRSNSMSTLATFASTTSSSQGTAVVTVAPASTVVNTTTTTTTSTSTTTITSTAPPALPTMRSMSRLSLVSTSTTASSGLGSPLPTAANSGMRPRAVYGVHEARAVTLVQAQPTSRTRSNNSSLDGQSVQGRVHGHLAGQPSVASLASTVASAAPSATNSSATATTATPTTRLTARPTPTVTTSNLPDAAATTSIPATLSTPTSRQQPTPPLSPSSVDFYLRSPPADGSLESGLEDGASARFMAVSRQEEMLLAALRMKRANMLRESMAMGGNNNNIGAALSASESARIDNGNKTAGLLARSGSDDAAVLQISETEEATTPRLPRPDLGASSATPASAKEAQSSRRTSTATSRTLTLNTTIVTSAKPKLLTVEKRRASPVSSANGSSRSRESHHAASVSPAALGGRRSRSLLGVDPAESVGAKSEPAPRTRNTAGDENQGSERRGRREREEEKESRRERVLLYLDGREDGEAEDANERAFVGFSTSSGTEAEEEEGSEEEDADKAVVVPFKLDLDLSSSSASAASDAASSSRQQPEPAADAAAKQTPASSIRGPSSSSESRHRGRRTRQDTPSAGDEDEDTPARKPAVPPKDGPVAPSNTSTRSMSGSSSNGPGGLGAVRRRILELEKEKKKPQLPTQAQATVAQMQRQLAQAHPNGNDDSHENQHQRQPTASTIASSRHTAATSEDKHQQQHVRHPSREEEEGVPRPDSPISPVAPLFQHRFPIYSGGGKRPVLGSSSARGSSTQSSDDESGINAPDVSAQREGGGRVRLSAVGGW